MSWLKRGRDKVGDTPGSDPLAWVGDDSRSDDASSGERERSSQESNPSDRADRSDRSESGSDVEPEHGPWDVSQVQASDDYVDLGGLWLPGRDGLEIRLEVEEDTGRVTAVTVQLSDSAVQLQAFAAPRSQGIWDEIRREIAASVTRQGGTADEVPGPFGRELLARVPTRGPDGRTAHQPARFAGIDGPRWFLRAVFQGQAAYQADQAAELESLVKDIVVVRGSEAMAPRELLTLRLPNGVGEGEAGDTDGESDVDSQARDSLRPFERGPEITEVR